METLARDRGVGVEVLPSLSQVLRAHSDRWPSEAERLLSTPTLKVVQNALFDVPRLHAAGAVVNGPFWDTMLAAQIDDPDAPGYSLNELASYYLDTRRWKHLGAPGSRPRSRPTQTWKRPKPCGTCSEPTIVGRRILGVRICERCLDLTAAREMEAFREAEVTYNRTDTAVLLPIALLQRQRLARTGQLQLFEQMMRVLEEVLIPLQERGLRIDTTTREEVAQRLARQAHDAKEEWEQVVGTDRNPRSVPVLKRLLYTEWGLPLQFDKDGAVSTGLEALHALLPIAPPTQAAALRALIAYREASHWLETYVLVGDRIYPSYGPVTKDSGRREKAIASTGRIIAKGGTNPDGTKSPPLQQFPAAVRRIIVPEPGCLFVHADYKQQELRLIAARSRCVWLLARIDRKPDVFDDIGTALACDRTRAKNVFYGTWVYGGSARAGQAALRAKGFLVTEEQVEEYMELGKRLCPELAVWQTVVLTRALRDGFLTNSFGRRREFRDLRRNQDGVFRGSSRGEALNYLIQSDGADVQWYGLPEMERTAAAHGGHLSILMHDGFDFQVPRDAVGAFVPALRAVMEREWPQIAPGLRLPIEVSVGECWGGADQQLEGG